MKNLIELERLSPIFGVNTCLRVWSLVNSSTPKNNVPRTPRNKGTLLKKSLLTIWGGWLRFAMLARGSYEDILVGIPGDPKKCVQTSWWWLECWVGGLIQLMINWLKVMLILMTIWCYLSFSCLIYKTPFFRHTGWTLVKQNLSDFCQTGPHGTAQKTPSLRWNSPGKDLKWTETWDQKP